MKHYNACLFLVSVLLGLTHCLYAQNVGIGTISPASSAILDITSTNRGFLIPRMTTAQRDAIVSPVTGLQIFNLDDECVDSYDGSNWIKTCGFKVTGVITDPDHPTPNSWVQKANFGGTSRVGAVGFSIGDKGFIGTGYAAPGILQNDLWEYSPSTNIWTQKANLGMSAQGRQNAVGFSVGNKGYIGSGYGPSGYTNDFWEYNPNTNIWTQKSNIGGTARNRATGFSIGTKGYVGTGYDGTYLMDFWEYNPINDTWVQKANFAGSARYGAIGFSIGNKGYIGTGVDEVNLKNDFWEYDPATNTWTQKTDFGGTSRWAAVGFSIGNKGFIGTGADINSSRNDFWEYDPINNTWIQKTDFGGTARIGAVGFSIGKKGYVGTGSDLFSSNNDVWEYLDNNELGFAYSSQTIDTDSNSVNDGAWTLFNDKIYNSNSGNVGIGTNAPAAKLHVAGNVRIADGSQGAGKVLTSDVNGQASWQTPTADNWGMQVVQTNPTLTGNGTSGNPLQIGQQGAATGQTLKWNGTAWVPGNDENTGDNWGTQVVQTNPTLTGNGTSGNPLQIGQQGATAGQTLKWNGTAWVPGNDENTGDNWGTQVVQTNATLTGTGTSGDPLKIGQQGAATGQTLKWNGTAWLPGNDENSGGSVVSVNASSPLASSGGTSPTISLGTVDVENGGTGLTSTPANGQILIGNGTDYTLGNLTPGSGITINNGPGTVSISTAGGTLNGGTNNYVTKWNSATTLSSTSQIYDDGVNVVIGTGTPAASAKFEISSTNKGFLMPRMTTIQRDAIVSPATGLQIFNLDDECVDSYDGTNWIKTCGFKVTGVATDPEHPTPNSWAQKANFGGLERNGAVGFSIGDKGYIGTGYDGSRKNDFWEYSPSTNTWTQKADVGGSVRRLAVGFSISDKGYIGTGDANGGFIKDFWEYNPSTNSWTQKADFGGTARYSPIGFSIGGKGYLGTGLSAGGVFKNDFWEYNPSNDTWTQKADFGGTARNSAVGFSINGKGYICTGYDNSIKKDFWEYNPITDTWIQKADFGGMARYSAIGFSMNGKGYVGTGYDNSNKKDFWEYNPITDTWTQKADFGGTARNSTVGFSVGNRGFIGTGYDGVLKNDFWEYMDDNVTGNAYSSHSINTTNSNSMSDGAWTLINNTVYSANSVNVGIGTSYPVNKLDVEGGLAIGASYSGANTAPSNGAIIQGNVGIGTSTPANKLDVEGGLAVGTTYSGSNAAPADGAIIEGNIGVGTSSPNAKLHVAGTGIFGTSSNVMPSVNTRGLFRYVNGATRDATVAISAGNCGTPCSQPDPSTSLVVYNENATNALRSGIAFSEQSTYSNNYAYWIGLQRTGSAEGGTGNLLFKSGNAGTFTDRVVFRDNGDVGIGTASPGARLEVSGSGRFTSANTSAASGTGVEIDYNGAGNGAGRIFCLNRGTSSFVGLAIDGNHLLLNSTSTGNVGIGTSSPSQKLSVSGNICYTGSIGACSDLRYKKLILPLTNALDKVSRLQGVSYYWKAEEFPDKQFREDRQIGFIAQDIEKEFPEVVITDADGYKSVDYSKLTPILVEAIKALRIENEKLKEDNKTFKASVDLLMSQNEVLEADIDIIKTKLGIHANAKK